VKIEIPERTVRLVEEIGVLLSICDVKNHDLYVEKMGSLYATISAKVYAEKMKAQITETEA
jgi:hypothetical protein